MDDVVYPHPLVAIRARMKLSAERYLKLVNRHHKALGLGAMACRREKVCRWEKDVATPHYTAQLAMADLHGVPRDVVDLVGWPHWLRYAFPEDEDVLSPPWTPRGTVAAMAACVRGGAMDRRGFLITTGTTLGTLAADWSGALNGVLAGVSEPVAALAEGRGRRLTVDMVAAIEQRLAALRRLDDVMGGGELRQAARAEFDLLNRLADGAGYDETTGRRLFSAVAEAGRICGWVHHDHGLNAAAQKYFITALRASATAGDDAAGAGVLAFMAMQTYTVGDPREAVGLVQAAQERMRRHTTPRLQCLVHTRAARAYSKIPYGRHACARELEKAREAWAKGPHDDDPPWVYWVTPWEIEMVAASSAVDLGDPRRALRFFDAARAAGDSATTYVKDDTGYLVRAARAHLALGEIDEACGVARQAYVKSKTMDSARHADALADFRSRLSTAHRGSRAAKEFLELTASAG